MQRAWPVGRFARGAAAGFAAMLAICLHAAPALAQGSTGGSIGKQDKSLSGGQDSGARSAPRERAAPREKSTSRGRERPSRGERPRRGGGGVANFDGVWNSASFGRTCPDRATDVVTISGGLMSGTGFSGRVSGSGSVSGVWAGNGLSAVVSGRMSGRHGSGSFRRSDGCVGSWTLSKN